MSDFYGFTIPTVVERGARGERAYDLFSRLMEDRIIMVNGEVNSTMSAIVTGQLLFLAKEDSKKPISMYINSPGGSVTAGLAIYDTMKFLKCPVSTVCMGQAASMGAILLSGGTKGKRYSLPNSRIMVHQPWGGAQGTVADIQRQYEEINKLRDVLENILVENTGQKPDKIHKDTDRDFFMSAEEAVEYGIVDHVITQQQDN